MDNIKFQPHILIDHNNEELFKEFIEAIEKTIKNNNCIFMPPALNYINEKRRKISLENIINCVAPSLAHFCSEGICNYYHYKTTNGSVYIIKESISHTNLHDRIYCFLEI
jgi:hypothetical protein